MGAVVHRNEHHRPRADVEDHLLLHGFGSHEEVIGIGVGAHAAILQPAVPGSVRPAQAALRSAADFKQSDGGPGGVPVSQVLQLQRSHGAAGLEIHETQLLCGGVCDRSQQLRIEADRKRQGSQGGDHGSACHIELAAGRCKADANRCPVARAARRAAIVAMVAASASGPWASAIVMVTASFQTAETCSDTAVRATTPAGRRAAGRYRSKRDSTGNGVRSPCESAAAAAGSAAPAVRA